VYQGNISLGNYRLSFAPYNIIPTLIAVLFKLCWGTVDSAFRRLTPVLHMLKRPQRAQTSIVSYLSIPIAWITIVAARNKHWLLVIVTFGALLLETLQVSMSALCSRELGYSSHKTTFNHQLKISGEAHTFLPISYRSESGVKYEPSEAYPEVLELLYGGSNFQNSWLFGGLVQSSFNGTSPSWSKDNWGFPPVDFSIVNVTSGNATFDTTALSGGIECTPINNSSRWITIQNLTDPFAFNTTANPTNLSTGYELSSNIRKAIFPSQPPATNLSIGQWLYSGFDSDANTVYDSDLSQNFTILWVEAGAPLTYYGLGQQFGESFTAGRVHTVFSQRPRVQAINCAPVFEKASAEVTVSVENGQVQKYKILDEPQNATEAWGTKFVGMTSGNGSTINTTAR
jgi:hypothetical protein